MPAQMEAMWASGRISKLTPLNLTAARRKIKIIRNGYGFNYLESIFIFIYLFFYVREIGEIQKT